VSERRRCVLAYSGGLDTSVAVRWLQDELDYEVVTLTADLGGEGRDAATVTERALRAGAVAAHVLARADRTVVVTSGERLARHGRPAGRSGSPRGSASAAWAS